MSANNNCAQEINAPTAINFEENKLKEEEVNELVDRIHSAKESLVLFGRQVFRISSDFGELSRTHPDSFRQLAAEHKLFANKEIVHAQMEEFYKASINYIELLREINRRAIELSGTAAPKKNL